MDEKFSEYARNIVGYLSDSLSTFYQGGVDDTKILESWFKRGIPEHFIKVIIHELVNEKGNKVKISDIDKLVKEKYRNFRKEEEKTLRSAYEFENIPEKKVLKLYEILKNVLLEIDIDDFSIIEELKNISGTSKFQLEKDLIRFEGKFFTFLFKHSPFSKDCLTQAREKLESYKFYWPAKTYELTLKALVKKCLKEKHGIPEFTTVKVR